NEGAIAAFELDEKRHQSLVSNLQRCGVVNCATWAKPGQHAAALPEAFDKVLLDAPCTGEGVIARDPTRRQGQLQEYEACSREQAELIDTAWRILRPGGILLYATCTLAPEENELQVDAAVRSGRFAIEAMPSAVRDVRIEGAPLWPGLARVGGRELHGDLKRTLHALPHLHGCLGFYLARLRKEAT
ncbi:MAG: RsmB/NOP family class I SAM-dependent RNA methyltransferase, partial [Euryarchaeota archaeon]|nr:RsmB/NOP family class I SAM-dependent RNA methyltransferase [Euryarchaeota archaeon]